MEEKGTPFRWEMLLVAYAAAPPQSEILSKPRAALFKVLLIRERTTLRRVGADGKSGSLVLAGSWRPFDAAVSEVLTAAAVDGKKRVNGIEVNSGVHSFDFESRQSASSPRQSNADLTSRAEAEDPVDADSADREARLGPCRPAQSRRLDEAAWANMCADEDTAFNRGKSN